MQAKTNQGYSIYPEAGKRYKLRITNLIDQYEMTQWVCREAFLKYEDEKNKIIPRSKSNRISVYTFQLPWSGKTVIMKVSEINSRYKISRKIELLLRRLVKKDYNESAFEGCCALRVHGILVANPLAFWAIYKGVRRKSYFLYEKVEKAMDGEKLTILLRGKQNDNAGQCLNALLSKIVWNIQNIHKTGWRHGDPAPRNFLFDLSASAESIRPEDIKCAEFCLIDFDGCHSSKIKIPLVKKFFDLEDLSKTRSLGFSSRDVLMEYQDGSYSYFWNLVLAFWLKGGFRLGHWFGQNPKRTLDSHLKNS